MKNVAIVDDSKVELIDSEMPVLEDDKVLIKIHTSLICTWEQRIFLRQMPFPLPFIGGHEFSGVIEAIGKDLDPESYPIGAQVTARLINQCGECAMCRENAQNMCQKIDNAASIGGLAEYVAVPPQKLYLLKRPIPFERLAFAEPLGCVLTAFDKLNVQPGDDVVIIGAGTLGVLNALVGKMFGARVIISETLASKHELPAKLGFQDVFDPILQDPVQYVQELTDGKGADVVIDCVTAKTAAQQALKMLATKGALLMFSKVFPEGIVEVDFNQVHDRDLLITGSMSASVSAFQRAVNLLAKGILKPDEYGLISGLFPSTQAQEAFELAIRPETYRVGITF